MPTYLITNRAPAGMSPSGDAFAAWTAWFDELDDRLVDRGNPAFAQTTVGNCGPETVLGGYTLIEADDLASAAELARLHPLVNRGGGVEIAELTILNAGRDLAADYQKTFRVNGSADAVFDALTTLSGLAGWWTDVTGSGETGGELRFRFDPPEPCVMTVDDATRPTSVRWTVTECRFLPDWVGTHPTFTIVPIGGDSCELQFRHQGLTAALECIEMCSRGWDHFLASLRQYVEVGRGMPRGSAEDTARKQTVAPVTGNAT